MRSLSPNDQALVDRFRNLMRDQSAPFLEVIAYGSRARGDATEESDLDLLVVVEKRDIQIRELISYCAWVVSFDSGVLLQTVVMTRDEIENSP
ncbi:MAG: nucleotidyltransferase domain-containing protein, partial [Candidatus Sumerlaeota bacterium]|nr:nucleotidyltransferase domain-containing protein [Candidatus Sumerlaeota bacterium]